MAAIDHTAMSVPAIMPPGTPTRTARLTALTETSPCSCPDRMQPGRSQPRWTIQVSPFSCRQGLCTGKGQSRIGHAFTCLTQCVNFINTDGEGLVKQPNGNHFVIVSAS